MGKKNENNKNTIPMTEEMDKTEINASGKTNLPILTLERILTKGLQINASTAEITR